MRDERVWALFGRTPIHFYEYVYVRSGLKSDLKSWVISLPVCVFCLLPLCVCFASCFLFYAKRRRDEGTAPRRHRATRHACVPLVAGGWWLVEVASVLCRSPSLFHLSHLK